MVRTPYRVSFAGGGTDLLEYSRKFGGLVVGCSIDRYVTLTLKGKPSGAAVVNESDLLRCSGLGGSAAYLAGMAKLRHPQWTRFEVIESVTKVEKLGQQDQILCVLGGLRTVLFNTDDSYTTYEMVPPEWLNSCMSLYFMGKRQTSGKSLLTGLNEEALKEQLNVAHKVIKALADEDFEAFVLSMREAWESKRRFHPDLCNEQTKEFEKRLRQNGVRAFKLSGAGGGGYALLIHDPDTLPAVGFPVHIDFEGQVELD